MRIYIAARLGRRLELRRAAKRIEDHGHEIGSSWLWSNDTYETSTPASLQRWAIQDLQEIDAADAIFLFTDPDLSHGGREVELGYGLGRGKVVYLFGPRVNVFHYLPGVLHFASLDDYLTHYPIGSAE